VQDFLRLQIAAVGNVKLWKHPHARLWLCSDRLSRFSALDITDVKRVLDPGSNPAKAAKLLKLLSEDAASRAQEVPSFERSSLKKLGADASKEPSTAPSTPRGACSDDGDA